MIQALRDYLGIQIIRIGEAVMNLSPYAKAEIDATLCEHPHTTLEDVMRLTEAQERMILAAYSDSKYRLHGAQAFRCARNLAELGLVRIVGAGLDYTAKGQEVADQLYRACCAGVPSARA